MTSNDTSASTADGTGSGTGSHPATSTGPVRAHRGLVWTLVAVAAVVLLVTSMTAWVKRQALDTDSWTRASVQLLQDDQIRQALSVYVVDQLYANVDVSGQLEQKLPPNLAGLSGPLAGALRDPAVRAVDELLQTEQLQAIWERVNRVAHEQLLAILEGNPRPNISTEDGTVALDLRSFVIDVGTQLGIGERLETTLPADVGQVTVLHSDELGAAQNAVKIVKRLSILLGLLVLLLWAAAVWLAAGWRRETLRAIAGSLVIVGLLLLVIRRVAGSYVVDSLTDPGSVRDAGHNAWLLATSLLAEIGWAGVIYGVVLLAGTWFVGPSRAAVRSRAAVGPFVTARPGMAWAGLAVAFLLVVWAGPTPALRRPLGVLLLGVLVAVGFELVRRQVATEEWDRPQPEPEATPAPPSAPIPAARG